MPFTINLTQLEQEQNEFEGVIPVEDLDLDLLDELIVPQSGLFYQLFIDRHANNLLLQGEIHQDFECEC